MESATEREHAEMVAELVKHPLEIALSLNPGKIDLWHAATGVCTEAGELLDAVKKIVIYDKPLDRENVIEELGDIEFYMAQVRANLNLDRNDILYANIQKLRKRYAKGYSDRAAQERADKSGAKNED